MRCLARGRWLLLALLSVVPGCRGHASVSPDATGIGAREAWPEPPPEGFVVLPFGTRVYLEPRFGGATARLGAPWLPPPPWPATGYVARVVGPRDGFVELAPIMPTPPSMVAPAQSHCGPLLDGEAFDVRFYVSPWALAPVLAQPVDAELDDGSALSLRPGAVARPIPNDPQGRWAVMAGGIRVRAVLPDHAMALAYVAPLPITMPMQRGWDLPAGRPFSYGGWPLEVELGFGQDVAIASVMPHGDDQLVELTSACARVVAHSTQTPVAWGQQRFDFMEFGLGAPHAMPERVLAGVGIDPPLESEPPPPEPPPLDELVAGIPIENDNVPGPVLEAEIGSVGGFGLIGAINGPARPEHVFEEGAPIYLSTGGPIAGTLAQLRVFSEDSWVVGDRMCFHTSFGSRFDPMLPVCLPVAEARLRNPTLDVFDFSAVVVHPGSLHITGALAEPVVARMLRRKRTDFRRCAGETMMRGLPPPSGELELALAVSGNGTVTHVELRSPRVEWLTDCVVAAATQWALLAPQDGKPAEVVLAVHLQVQ